MKKNFTSTLVMLGIFLGLVGWYVLFENKYKTESRDKEEQSKKLVSLETGQVTEFKLSRLKNPPKDPKTPESNLIYETIEVKKTGPDWFIVSPIQTKGDSTAINSLISSVCSAKQERVVDEKPSDLAIYGLKDPLLKLAIKKEANSAAQEISLGLDTPVAYGIYGKSNQSDSVFKTNRALKGSVDKDLLALRNRNVVDINKNDITEVEIQNSQEDIVLSQSGNNLREEWTLSRDNLPADPTEWNKTLTPLVELKAVKFVAEKADNLAPYGLNKPIAKITFVKSDKVRSTLLLGKTKDGLFAKIQDRDAISEIDKTIEEKINTPSSKYQNKHLASFDRFEVKKIQFLRGKDILEILKSDKSGWKFANDPSTQVDSSQVDSFLTKLQDAQLKRYLNQSSKTPLENPNLKILLFEANGQSDKEVVNLSFSRVSPDLIRGQNTGVPFQFEISTDEFNKINVFRQTLIKTEEKPKESEKPSKKS